MIEETSLPQTASRESGQPLHTERFRVVLGDTDAAGIIYFGAPTGWHERQWTAWLNELGMPLSSLLARGQGTPAVHTEIDYLSPLRLDEEVVGTLWPVRAGERSFTLESRFSRAADREPAVLVRVTMVFVSGFENGRIAAAALPEVLSTALRR